MIDTPLADVSWNGILGYGEVYERCACGMCAAGWAVLAGRVMVIA